MGIELIEGFEAAQLDPAPDVVVVGNVMTRGQPVIEALLDRGMPYASGPEWLAREVLKDRWVLAVAGTHGKTTTSSLLAWILEHAGLAPGFLIGGVPANFGLSARLGAAPFFVIEADEYDTAFFDKRAKFVHYRPRTAGAEQPRVRPRRHLSGRGLDPAPVPPSGAHRARQRAASSGTPAMTRLRADAGHGLLDAAGGLRARSQARRHCGARRRRARTSRASRCWRASGRAARSNGR